MQLQGQMRAAAEEGKTAEVVALLDRPGGLLMIDSKNGVCYRRRCRTVLDPSPIGY